MRRVLIANRGEIAFRLAKACRKAGLESVAVYSEADVQSPHVWAADAAVCIGPAAPAQSYLNADAILAAAQGTGCDALHPGYGFLSESPNFAQSCRENDIIFIGPSPEIITMMGDKVSARSAAAAAGIPIVPGSKAGFSDVRKATEASKEIGFPLLLKASAGGGGRGMRVVNGAEEFEGQFQQATSEARAAFNNGEIYLERFFPRIRHIEVQVFGDMHGKYQHLGERDCTIQRRHQKLVEEAPANCLNEEQRNEIREAAEALTKSINYTNAGTVEFIFDEEKGKFYFIEMNTRIQVEHPVTEAVTGTDLVVEQLRVAAGEPLSFGDERKSLIGHAIEWRINAEDATRGFMPAPGTVNDWAPSTWRGVRLDSHCYPGYRVSPYYDSLLGKLIVTGRNREDALRRSQYALENFNVSGVQTLIPFFLNLLHDAEFLEGNVYTSWLDERLVEGSALQ